MWVKHYSNAVQGCSKPLNIITSEKKDMFPNFTWTFFTLKKDEGLRGIKINIFFILKRIRLSYHISLILLSKYFINTSLLKYFQRAVHYSILKHKWTIKFIDKITKTIITNLWFC